MFLIYASCILALDLKGGRILKKFFNKYIGDSQFIKEVLIVAIPLMLQSLITTSVNLVDNLMVGQLGDAAIGGVAAVNRYYMIGMFGTNGMIAAAGIFIAQFFGAHDENHMKQSFRFSILTAYLIILPIFMLAFFFPEMILHFFTNEQEVITLGIDYLRLACFSFLPTGLSLAITGALRSIGEAKFPLFVSICSVATNTFFNYCFIFGNFGAPAMGVVGAALATLIARLVEMSLLLAALYKWHFPFKTKVFEIFHINSQLAKRILVKAAPLAINEILWSGGMATIFKLYGTRGQEVLSGYSVSTTTTDLFFTLFQGMMIATTVMVSQRLGANKLDEARDNAYRLVGTSASIAIAVSFLMYGASYIIPDLYSISPKALEVAQNMIRIQSICFILYTMNTQNYFILRAGGDTKSTLITDSCFMWFVNIPLLAVIAYLTDINIYLMFILGQSTDLLKLFISTYLVRKEKWVVNLAQHPEEALEFND